MTTWTIWLLSALLALSVALCIWSLGSAATSVPDEDRTYKDPPPIALRMMWWAVHPLAFGLDALIGETYRHKTARRLQQAGLEFQLTPGQFVAARLVSALIWSLVGAWTCYALRIPVARMWVVSSVAGMIGFTYVGIWLNDRIKARKRELQKTFPFFLDIIVLCVEAGLNFTGALQQACSKGPQGVMQDEMRRVIRDLRAGKPRVEALKDLADRVNDDSVSSWVTTVVQAESLGVSLGPALRAQAEHKRTERFLRAEEMAMKAPVKMLLPLVVCILPCTGLILMFPIAMQLLDLFRQ